MDGQSLDPRLYTDLKGRLERGLVSGSVLRAEQVEAQLSRFRERFGPAALQQLDGEALLHLMHGRTDSNARSLVYWLEFKNDDEFAGPRFGSILGGTALKFGVYQRQSDNSWITGSTKNLKVIPVADAIEIARQQRQELVAGANELAKIVSADGSDAAYATLQSDLERVAPSLSESSWAHKYWFLTQPDHLDCFHSASYQRFHVFKLLQMPPDGLGIWNGRARFVCAGRFATAARSLGTTNQALSEILSQRSPFHRYWRINSPGRIREEQGRSGEFLSIGWRERLPDLSEAAQGDRGAARSVIQKRLLPVDLGSDVARLRAREVLHALRDIAENDLVVACERQTVLGIGRVVGPYEYHADHDWPHQLPIEWLSTETWQMPEEEGSGATVNELGNKARNLLEIERHVISIGGEKPHAVPTGAATPAANPLAPLDPVHARIDGILRRKGQVLLYGPPGTGKTFHALGAARELAARQSFRKGFEDLAADERRRVEEENALVRICTFHPGYGYEDFIEGLRPRTVAGSMVFEPRDGIFKRLCLAAAQEPHNHFFLVIDEINRGDLPRIFGELITVIEANKRGLKITLPMSGTVFSVPANVFVIGTMNTADRSISILDTALRRRFGFIELMPDSAKLAGQKAGTLALAAWLEALNARLRKHLKRDARNLQIGHAYLMPRQPIRSVAEFSRVLRDDVIPLLEEYCYDDFQMLREILGKELVDVEVGRIREEMFTPAREADLILALSTFEEMESAREIADVADVETGSGETGESEADEDGVSA